ncbi:hypothetical protein Tco_0226601 [Tanacetum coccineum]
MADLTFVDSHNMAAYLEKSEDNADFAEIVDFFNASPIMYALTNETVHEERGDNIERAATTATSLDAEQGSGSSPRRQDTILGDKPAQTRFERLSKQFNDPPLLRTAQDLEITNLKKRVKKLEKKKKSRTPQLKRRLFKGRYGHDISTAKVTTANVPSDVDVSAASPIRPVDDSITDDITLAETLMKIKSSALRSQKDKGVMFKEPSEPTTTSRPQS